MSIRLLKAVARECRALQRSPAFRPSAAEVRALSARGDDIVRMRPVGVDDRRLARFEQLGEEPELRVQVVFERSDDSPCDRDRDW